MPSLNPRLDKRRRPIAPLPHVEFVTWATVALLFVVALAMYAATAGAYGPYCIH